MRGPGRPRRRAVVAAATVVLAASLSGCTAARNVLGTSDSSCFVALPVAAAAVHGHGRQLGVRLVNVSSLHRGATSPLGRLIHSSGNRESRVCLVAFAGKFTSSSVAKPAGRPSAQVAVVVIGYPDRTLLGTLLTRLTPLHFGHSHLG